MKVKFSHHAAQRMAERLSVKIPAYVPTDISGCFRRARKYTHHDGKKKQAWVYTKNTEKHRIVLVVDDEKLVVSTVFCGGDLTPDKTKQPVWVDWCYAGLKSQQSVSA